MVGVLGTWGSSLAPGLAGVKDFRQKIPRDSFSSKELREKAVTGQIASGAGSSELLHPPQGALGFMVNPSKNSSAVPSARAGLSPAETEQPWPAGQPCMPRAECNGMFSSCQAEGHGTQHFNVAARKGLAEIEPLGGWGVFMELLAHAMSVLERVSPGPFHRDRGLHPAWAMALFPLVCKFLC